MQSSTFNEIVFLSDRQSPWVWNHVCSFFTKKNLEFIQVDPSKSLRTSWSRIQNTPKLVIHWESGKRLGGAVIEELLQLVPNFDLEERLVVITSDPRHEDYVYFSELGVSTIVEMRNNPIDIKNAAKKLQELFFEDLCANLKQNKLWRMLLIALENLNESSSKDEISHIRAQIEKVGELDEHKSARYFHALATYYSKTNQPDPAEEQWQRALQLDGNFFPAKTKMIDLYCQKGDFDKALYILKQSQGRNKNNVSRLVKMGEIHHQLRDIQKAEHYFSTALEKDEYCSAALNGMAAIRFEQGELEESRTLLAQSSMASKVASSLNQQGIVLVRDQKFEEALNHYSKAQYVLPQQDKSPMLFFNMGLCYSRWGKIKSAKQFLQLALIKEPNYIKARKLLEQLSA